MALLDTTDAVCVLVGDAAGAAVRRRPGGAGAALGLGGPAALVGQCDDMPAALMLADVVGAAPPPSRSGSAAR